HQPHLPCRRPRPGVLRTGAPAAAALPPSPCLKGRAGARVPRSPRGPVRRGESQGHFVRAAVQRRLARPPRLAPPSRLALYLGNLDRRSVHCRLRWLRLGAPAFASNARKPRGCVVSRLPEASRKSPACPRAARVVHDPAAYPLAPSIVQRHRTEAPPERTDGALRGLPTASILSGGAHYRVVFQAGSAAR